jgi:uncharacterized protein
MPRNNGRAEVLDTAAIVWRSALGWAIAGIMGAAAMAASMIPGVLPPMIAAQITAGVIGLCGGLSYVHLIGFSGGSASRTQGFLLPVVWAASSMLAVTPLFFTSGPPLKLLVLTFYSFALSGALGGVVTARLMRPLFPAPGSRDLAPPVVIWSFSFGLAAVASTIVGEGLQAHLPAGIAWFIAFEAMALIMGSGGGFAVVWCLRPARLAEGPSAASSGSLSPGEDTRRAVTVLILLCLPFYLNDFADIFVADWRLWLAIDYIAVKLVPLAGIGWLIGTKKMASSAFGLKMPSALAFGTVFLIAVLTGIFLDQNGYRLVGWLPGYPALGAMPVIADPLWRGIDLTAGLLLVGVCEEAVFRGYLGQFLSRYTRSAAIIIGVSALAFGLIHWGGGLHKIIVTSVIGAVFMALYLRTRSVPALILAHFVVNLVDSLNAVPKSLFSFF